jgi:DNA-binding SARP family transcriptional activator
MMVAANSPPQFERCADPYDQAPVVHLIGGPFVSQNGACHAVPEGSKRLLAFVALHRGRVERLYTAGALWPFGNDLRAAGNLRSALWRLRRAGIDVIDSDKWSLSLAPQVQVDVHQLAGWASRLIHRTAEPDDLTTHPLPDTACHLLPGWYDDWVVMERERLRQRVLHALESLAEIFSQLGRHAEAVEAATRAVSEEPLRESAQRALVAAYLAQGNDAQAHLAYAAFAQLLDQELGVKPSRRIRQLLNTAESSGQPVGLRSRA